jgi:AraC family transcriptional regulator
MNVGRTAWLLRGVTVTGPAMLGAPVSLGAERARRLLVPGFAVADLRFPAGLTLQPHDHQRTTVAVVMSGGFDGWWNGREGPCGPGTVLVEPAGERHANRFGPRSGTRVIVVQPDGDGATVPAGPRLRPDAMPLAWRMGEELRSPDDITPMALEGLALQLTALVARDAERPAPMAWPGQAAALIEDGYAQSMTLSSLASQLDLSPSHVARAFRRRHGRSVGAYVRDVRVRRAAERLATGDESLAEIALAVGFADQSHLNRWFVRRMGVTPGRYRRALRER